MAQQQAMDGSPDGGVSPQVARQMWSLFEPVHAVTYFSPEARSAFAEAGLRGFWRGYFAGRVAPLGEAGPVQVTAAFFSFAAPMVSRALPAVWGLITPADALRVRSAGAVAALRRLLSGSNEAAVPAATTAAGLLTGVIDGIDCAGRVLAAANAALPVPGDPLARLWHAVTVLREHRGDGHVAALVAAGLDGCEALVLRAGMDLSREMLQPIRGWDDAAWERAADRLAGRGWIGSDGRVTAAGAAAHRAVEQATDLAAARPWAALGPDGAAGLLAALGPVARACAADLPYPNPVGMPAPAFGQAAP
jgi:ElaB/YqjD/DUF883 family membrane-anchored ribosome-binding protein